LSTEERTPGERRPRLAQRAQVGPASSRRTRLFGRGAIVAVGAVLVIGVAFAVMSIARASSVSKHGASGAAKSSQNSAAPTAVFAYVSKYRVAIHFPAAPDDMLDVGFHQAYNTKAYAFLPTMKTLPIAKPAVTEQLLASDSSLRLFEQAYRARGSSERSAADCAVRPDSRLLSPVTGTVTLLKHYKLEGRIDDLQLEIKPDGASLLRVVMIHIQDATVKVGDRVVGGITPVATVRHLTLDSSVNRYLPVSPADHTHIQVNDQRYRLSSS
jgi:hypothetical protein